MIKIEIDDREVRAALARLQARVSHMQPAMDFIGQALIEKTREHIFSGRDWTGNPFAPNSPVTLARKRGARPLINHGDFVNSRLYHEASSDQVLIGASAVQSAVLQFGAKKGAFGQTRRGAKIPWGDIPARRYFPVSESGEIDAAARSLILEAIRAHLADG
jgi:phage gpG-like protein